MSDGSHNTCIFCGREDTLFESKDFVYSLNCVNCGSYSISRETWDDLQYELEHKYKSKKHLISGLLRELTENEILSEIITNDNFDNLIKDIRVPKTTQEKLDKLILYINGKTTYLKQQIPIISNQLAVGYALNEEELKNMVDTLKEQGYIEYKRTFGIKDGRFEDKDVTYFNVQLTIAGSERAEYLTKEHVDNKQCFVALWFGEDMLHIFETVISKAILDAGYNPFIISMKEHNGDITDEIIAEIKKSKFVVADFTGDRGGVYYEAGFARGIGLPVIYTCQEDWFNKEVQVEKEVQLIGGEIRTGIIKEARKVHFDINHYNFIVWKDGNDFYNKLNKRILATISKI